MISWMLSPDFLVLITVTLMGFLIFLFMRFSGSKKFKKDDPDFLLRDLSQSLSSNDSVEIISGSKTTFVSVEKETISNYDSLLQKSEKKNQKISTESGIRKYFKFYFLNFLKKNKYLPQIQNKEPEKIIKTQNNYEKIEKEEKKTNVIRLKDEEKTEIYEKISVEPGQSSEDLSQIELPFFPEEERHKNSLETEDSVLKENLTKDEVSEQKNFKLDETNEKNKINSPQNSERDEVLFSFSEEIFEKSKENELSDSKKIQEQRKNELANHDEIFDVLENEDRDSTNNVVQIAKNDEKINVISSEENPLDVENDYNPIIEFDNSASDLNASVNNKEKDLNISRTKFHNMEEMHRSLETVCSDLYLSVEKPSKKLSEYDVSLLRTIEEQIMKLTAEGESVSSDVLLRVGITYLYQQKYNKATSILKETLLQTEQLGFVLNALAVASFAKNNLESSITYSLEATRECGDDRILKATVLSNLGYFYLQKGELTKALKSYLDVLEEADLNIDTSLLPNLHLRVGKIFNNIGKKDEARRHLMEAIQLSQGKGKELTRIQSLVAVASTQTKSGSIEASLKSLEEALRISQLIGNREQEALIQGHMGLAFTAKDQFSKALLYHKKAVEIYKEIYNSKGEASNLASIANIHYFQDSLEEAQIFSERALELNCESDNLPGIALNLTNLGRVLFEKNEWAMSCEKLSEARDIYEKLGEVVRVNEIQEILNIAKSNEKKEKVV
ncbi:MAG: tetratricopeptide repeat protein [Nitrospinota bacterium]|nr:tetratricopeptide repeat protein [Nitrospinota bacterium]